MKVLLFVQTGDARPKAYRAANEHARRPQNLASQLRAWAGKSVELVRATNGGVFAAAFAADRWWLVECDNADEGRHVITGLCHSMNCALLRDDSHEASCDCGRIIASGGKQEVKP